MLSSLKNTKLSKKHNRHLRNERYRSIRLFRIMSNKRFGENMLNNDFEKNKKYKLSKNLDLENIECPSNVKIEFFILCNKITHFYLLRKLELFYNKFFFIQMLILLTVCIDYLLCKIIYKIFFNLKFFDTAQRGDRTLTIIIIDNLFFYFHL